MLNSHLAAKSFFSGLIFGFEMEKKEIPFPFPMSDLLKHPINSTNHHFHNIVVMVSCVMLGAAHTGSATILAWTACQM